MRIVKGFKKEKLFTDRNFVSIGSFDGIHIGHQAILCKVRELTYVNKGKGIVVTFDPLPREFFCKENLKVITTIDEKLKILQHLGVDGVVIIPFTDKFSKIEASDFLKKIWNFFHPYAIIVGCNHHFGKDGKGGLPLLRAFSREKAFQLIEVREVREGERVVSSSGIRDLIVQGNMKQVNEMLGRTFFFSARVTKGEGVGRTLSFPTANLEVSSPRKILPGRGVYVAKIVLNRKEYGAMLYLGKRPTFCADGHSRCELHIMGFSGNLYGKNLIVRVLKKIREEKKFRSAQNLKDQIMSDENTARKIIKGVV
ncbi:MAG: bifunctional riboflavin kinase/FAD synthetase [Candidatus Cloacimonadota bacterium]|nr:MAG: bifunctional riboflavin kinase/FAD synthetase [Candidatus Cloacimonadota bacterium]